jgi:hypothetical protein
MERLLITHPGCGFGRGMLLAGSPKESIFPIASMTIAWLSTGLIEEAHDNESEQSSLHQRILGL